MEGKTGTIIVEAILAVYLLYSLFWPFNWKFVKTNWRGVLITLGRIDESHMYSEGPVHVYSPFQRVRGVPFFDWPEVVEVTAPTAAPNSMDVPVIVPVVIHFDNPMKVIQSVQDQDPIDEVLAFIENEVTAAIAKQTVTELFSKNGREQLSRQIAEAIAGEDLFQSWGLRVKQSEAADVGLPDAIKDASARVTIGEADASAERIRAQGVADAMHKVGGLSAYLKIREQDKKVEMAKSGAFQTYTDFGIGAAFADLMRLLGGGDSITGATRKQRFGSRKAKRRK